MNREAEEFRISSDIKEANNEVLRGRLEQAEALLKRAAEICTFNMLDEIVVLDIEEFLASPQGQQCSQCSGSGSVSDSDGCGVWYIDCQSCTQKHPEQAEGAQGDDEWMPDGVVESLMRADSVDVIGMAIAALAQPSPCKSQVAEALRVADWSNTCIGNKALILAAIEQLEAQPSPAPAPELERPEVVDLSQVVVDELKHAYHERKTFSEASAAIMAAHDRIVGALREEASGWRAMSIVAANGKDELRHKLEAAQARLAELEKQLDEEEGSHLETIKQRDYAEHWADALAKAIADQLGVDIGEHSNLNNPWNEALVSMQQPVAQAGQVPEGWKLMPIEPTEDIIYAIHFAGYVGNVQELRDFYQAVLDAAPAQGGSTDE